MATTPETTPVILLTLLPTQPRAPDDFHTDLQDLNIDTFDLTVQDSRNGRHVGSAQGVNQSPYYLPIEIIPGQTTPHVPPKLRAAIIQHFTTTRIIPPPLDPRLPRYRGTPQSVATAVISVELDPPTLSEFDSLDLRIVLTRNGSPVGKRPLPIFNVPIRQASVPLSPEPVDWVGFDYETGVVVNPLTGPQGVTNVNQDPVFRAGYIFVPPVPRTPSTRPNVSISADGTTPVFDSLLTAVNEVLRHDTSSTAPGQPTDLQSRSTPLDAPQSLQVARELTYDRAVFPLPKPTPKKPLEEMYNDPTVKSDQDQERKQFEADLSEYQSQREAEALQLATFIYAVSAAIECEKLSLQATSAGISFDVVTRPLDPNNPFPSKAIVLKGVATPSNLHGFLSPTFGVPAAFFYALGCGLPSQLNAEDRKRAALVGSESTTLRTLQAARDNGILLAKESALTKTTDPLLQNLDVEQAARRLSALGSIHGVANTVNLDADVSDLIGDWLGYDKDSSTMSQFWVDKSTARQAQYLSLILDVITAENLDLKNEIKTALGINSVSGLANVTDKDWRNFWLPAKQNATDTLPQRRANMLPAFTLPGSPTQRTEAFIKFIKTLFSVVEITTPAQLQGAGDVQILSRPGKDALQMFFDASTGFSFANSLDPVAISTVLATLPFDERLRDWVNKALQTIAFLQNISSPLQGVAQTGEEQFSIMEGLYARGFVTANHIAMLSKAQFHQALAGTVAYVTKASGEVISDLIYTKSIALSSDTPDLGPEPSLSFTPINPGQLVDCIPPANFSPLGLIMYLKELLLLKIQSTTADEHGVLQNVSLMDALSTRCGTLPSLQASLDNLEIKLQLIDLANENLEALVEQLSSSVPVHGIVHDTDSHNLGDFTLGTEPGQLHPGRALIAAPQFGSPSVVSTKARAYQILQQDISSPLLPYDQELDINRSYLSALKSSRLEIKRTFRKDITEFALDASKEPDQYQRNLWRYPVRLDIAIEYLSISSFERNNLFTSCLHNLNIRRIYAFLDNVENWQSTLTQLPSFLDRTGLSYCEFYDLWKSKFVELRAMSKTGERILESGFPACEPCCLSSMRIGFGAEGNAEIILRKLAVFIRLWRKMELRYGFASVSMAVLSSVCDVLHMFEADDLNPDFIRQLIALLMLSDEFCLRLCEEKSAWTISESPALPQERVPLLALWADPSLQSDGAVSAVKTLLKGIEQYATRIYGRSQCNLDFRKFLEERQNLANLSKLAGFTKDISWNAKPTCTLRFAEVLAKIYASDFTVGEILFLFTNEDHLVGDDPFPYTEEDESIESPLNVPEDDGTHGLWELRGKLLNLCVDEEEVRSWTWRRIEHSLHSEFGLTKTASPDGGRSTDRLLTLGEHFFPALLESCGYSISPEKKQFRASLSETTPLMWEAPPCAPFHYSSATSELWMELPLLDKEVLQKLANIRQLRASASQGPSEVKAVTELYYAPRLMLAPFAAIFDNFAEAIDRMIQEPCEEERFAYFQRSFAAFYRRCKIVAEHLAAHVEHVMDECCDNEDEHDHARQLAWKIVKHLIADENRPTGQPWERNSGESPSDFLWDPTFSGSAFAALMGLTGTGILGEFKVRDRTPIWKQFTGPMSVFGHTLNKTNVPVPMVIPALNTIPTAEQRLSVVFQNGFARDHANADNLGGAQAFTVEWNGVLLVEKGGHYHFSINRPACRGDQHEDQDEQCNESCDQAKWVVKLRRGQKHFTLLNHKWASEQQAPASDSKSVCLLRGAYDIEISLEQPEPRFRPYSPLQHAHTGLHVLYHGPDTDGEKIVIPKDKLFIKLKDGPLSVEVEAPNDNIHKFLRQQYFSSLRDIRRTYLRAFKALLFVRRFRLSSKAIDCCHGASEFGFLLEHPVNFQGSSHYPVTQIANDANTPDTDTSRNIGDAHAAAFATHRANFDFNFFAVKDAYFPPTRDQDNRAAPSQTRNAALFDWWERIFDYRQLAFEVQKEGHCLSPVWRLFYDAATEQSGQDPVTQLFSDDASLARTLAVDTSLAPLTLKYFDGYAVKVLDLQDERWATRVWRSWQSIQRMQKNIYSNSFAQARPDLWAAPSPNSAVDTSDVPPQKTGNHNLIFFVMRSLLLDHQDPQYQTLTKLNDGLRVRANKALLKYLGALERVPLAFQIPLDSNATPTAKSPQDLSALLLQEVDVGPCETATRIEQAICSIQTFMQRLRLGLELRFALPWGLNKKWDCSYETFEMWKKHTKRIFYRENWIQWEELSQATESEAFRFFRRNLDLHSSALPNSSPPFVLSHDVSLPSAKSMLPIQARELALLSAQTHSTDEGIGLIGTPSRSSQPSWLAASSIIPQSATPTPTQPPGRSGGGGQIPPLLAQLAPPENSISLPMWFQAAIRIGTTFVRVAAASAPPAILHSWDKEQAEANSTCQCSKAHPPVVDEYYFWIEEGTYFDPQDAPQNATIGIIPPDPTTDWERSDKLGGLLHWPTKSQAYLRWTRIHYGEFSPPRRSAEGASSDASSGNPSLLFKGRKADSLLFDLSPDGVKGFRYDIATDSAVVTPQPTEAKFPSTPVPAPLSAYPFFVYFEPGAPISPVSPIGTALAISAALRAQCKFEEALAWCRTAFNPLERENVWPQCRRILLARDESGNHEPSHGKTAATHDGSAEDGADIPPGPCCPTSPVKLAVARARAVTLEYLQILLQWGDTLLCKNSFESRKQALVLFNEAIRLLGPKPSKINVKAEKFPSVTVSALELRSAPLNPKLLQLYETAYDRRGVIQRWMNSQRLELHPPIRHGQTANSACSLCADMSDPCGCGIGQGPCCLPYKFTFLLPKAMELVSVVKGLGGALLNALEKGDSEYLASLRQAHDRQLNDLVLSNKQNSWRESDWQIQALEQQMQGAQTRLRYNKQLLENGLNAGENTYLSGTTVGMQSRTAGNISEGIGQGMSFIPDFTVGGAGIASPVAVTKLPLGSKLAQVFQAASRILNTVADVSNTNAGIGSTSGGWTRRSDDWQHQVDVITIEIAQIKRQQLAAERRRDIALRELNNHKLQIENSAEADFFLRDKISKQDLYLFLQQETAQLYRRTFDLAWQTVKEAEAALRHERRDLEHLVATCLPPELGPAGWDNLRAGLMAGDRLEYGLRSLERMYLRESGCREYELTKHISLRLQFPLAFLQLKTLGYCELELPEWMFDMDYPGHYLRRIKNVSVTIPCVVGPYVGIHCRLQLLSSGIRMSPTLPVATKCCCKPGPSCIGPNHSPSAQSCNNNNAPDHPTCTSAYTDPQSIARDFLSTEAIATSTGQNDSGLFELSFRDEKLRAPFEYSGAADSRWRIDLPPQNNAFDLESVSDFILHLNYTAREGGAMLRDVADRATGRRLPGDGVRFFDVRSEFPNAFRSAFDPMTDLRGYGHGHHSAKDDRERRQEQRDDKSAAHHPRHHHKRRPPHRTRTFPLQFTRRSFPFLTNRRNVTISSIHIFIELNNCPTKTNTKIGPHLTVRYIPPSACANDVVEFECTTPTSPSSSSSSSRMSGFFQGQLEGLPTELLVLCDNDDGPALGCLEFDEEVVMAGVRHVYFLCGYRAVEREW